MSVEVDSGGRLPSGPEHTSHQPTDFSSFSMTSEWLRRQLDGPTNTPFPFNLYGGPFMEEIMGAYSLLPETLASQYDPVTSQLPFSFDSDSTMLQTTQSSSFMPHTTGWQNNNSQTIFTEPASDPRFISPKALTTPPGVVNDSQRLTHIPPSPIDLNATHSIQNSSQIPSSSLYAPFGYVTSSGISSTGASTPVTQAGYINDAHSTALPNTSNPQTSTSLDSQTAATPVYARPIYGNDPGFRHNTFRPTSDVARGAAKVEAFQDRAVYHNIFHPNDHLDLNLFAPPPKTEAQASHKTKRSHSTAGLGPDPDTTGTSPSKKARKTSISRPKRTASTYHEPPEDPSDSTSSPTSPLPPSTSTPTTSNSKRKSKSSQKLPSSPPTSVPPTSTSTSTPPRPRLAPKSAEERRKRHNESEKRRRDYFKVLRERLFRMVDPSYEINSKTIGAKHKAVVRWVIELRRGNLALWERAEREGIDLGEQGLALGSKGGKEELERMPRLFFEMDGSIGGGGDGSKGGGGAGGAGGGGGGGGGQGGRGEDAETGLNRILGTMEAIKMAGGG